MKETNPEDTTLGDPTRIRVFAADEGIIRKTSEKTGLGGDDVKRRAIHVGLPILAKKLGLKLDDLDGTKAA
jgi:hypothetical protein